MKFDQAMEQLREACKPRRRIRGTRCRECGIMGYGMQWVEVHQWTDDVDRRRLRIGAHAEKRTADGRPRPSIHPPQWREGQAHVCPDCWSGEPGRDNRELWGAQRLLGARDIEPIDWDEVMP